MKVYYNSSLWSKGRGLWGWPQRVNWQFDYAGAKRYIPAIYRFSKGIAFDVITILDEEKLKKFLERNEIAEGKELSPLQKRLIEQEHPCQDLAISRIWINGKQVLGGYSSSYRICIPWLEQEEALKPVRRAYSFILKDSTPFACQRYSVPYPETDSKYQKLLRLLRLEKVKSIRLSTFPVQRLYPLDIRFKMSAGEREKEIHFIHPVTGTQHKLYLQNASSIKVPLGEALKRDLYIMQAMYEIEPALPQSDSLQFDSSFQYTEEPEVLGDIYSPSAVASIGIIGGADGPTSIFISSKESGKTVPCGMHGLPLHSCYSVPSFQKENASLFHLEGINTILYDSEEFNLQ
ncbi:MAG: Na+-transporting methylmalonyl-CoA/oxaloacetate decarboxylase subunit beta [Tepidanaerobacteraceae bacterium]